MYFKSLLIIVQQLILIFIITLQSFTYWKNNAFFYIGSFIAKKMVANMKSIE